jgi:ferredoxin-type protein NapH
MSKTAEAIIIPAEDAANDKCRALPLRGLRRWTQLASLAIIGQWSFYGIFRCPFIVPYVSCQNCPVVTCHGRLFTMFWGFWLLIPVSALIFGRAFCGWACPGGLVNQLLGTLAPVKMQIRNAFARTTPYFKYLGLAIALYVWLFWGQPRAAVPLRVGEFFSSVSLTFEHANTTWLVRTFFVLGFVALGLLLANAWCRFACPSGGFFEALRYLSWFKVYKNEKCDDCDKCLKICEMGTRPSESNCTNCCDCLSVCPQKAIQVGRPRREM